MPDEYIDRRECELRHGQVSENLSQSRKAIEKNTGDLATLAANQARVLTILDHIEDRLKKLEAREAENAAAPKKRIDGMVQTIVNSIAAALVGAVLALIFSSTGA